MVPVDPIKPTLKAPGTNRLKLQHDEPLSNFAFNFNLRRYAMVTTEQVRSDIQWIQDKHARMRLGLAHITRHVLDVLFEPKLICS